MSTATQPDIIDAPVNALVRIATDHGLAQSRAHDLLGPLFPKVDEAGELVKQAATIQVTDATQVSEMQKARQMRLKIKALRCDAENVGKEIKGEYLKTTTAIDAARRWFKDTLEPVENYLQAQEEFAIRAEADRKALTRATRQAILIPLEVDVTAFDLAEMKEPTFLKLVEDARAGKARREAEALKAEEERKAAEARRIEDERKMREENEKLRKENEEADRKLAEERKATAAAAAKARAEQLEADRQAQAKQLELQRKIDEERRAKEKLEAEARAKQIAEEKNKAAEARAKKKAERAPDVEKIKAFATAVRQLPFPAVKSDEALRAISAIRQIRDEFANEIDRMAGRLDQ